MASRPQIVRVHDDAKSMYARHSAEVVKSQIRQRGPHTETDRYDYLLKFRDGSEMWFWDTEIVQ